MFNFSKYFIPSEQIKKSSEEKNNIFEGCNDDLVKMLDSVIKHFDSGATWTDLLTVQRKMIIEQKKFLDEVDKKLSEIEIFYEKTKK